MAFDERKAERVVRFIECLKHTKGEFHGKPFKLLDWQKKIVTDVFGTVRDDYPDQRQYTSAYIEIPKKNGKALTLTTPIPTPDGWKQMGELQVGDKVFDENGQPCNVLALSAVIDDEDVYRIKFRDGTYIEAGANHLWQVQLCADGYRNKIIRTEDMYEGLGIYRSRHRGSPRATRSPYRISVNAPLQLPDADLPASPYQYGIWLGNGKAEYFELTVLPAYLQDLLQKIPGEVCSMEHHKQYFRIRYKTPSEGLVKNVQDDRISAEFLRASEKQRRELLLGLMDSDGCVTKSNGLGAYACSNSKMAESFRELLCSLGIKSNVTVEHGEDGTDPIYVIGFAYVEKKTTHSGNYHYIDDIECLGKGIPIRCIQVDSPSHLYLAGPSMIPTHNSELGAALALNMLVNDDEWKAEVYSCAADRQQASIVFDVAVDMVQQQPYLSKLIKIIPSTKRMVYQPTGSIYQVLSSDVATKHGLNVSACIFDELHVQPNRKLYDVMTQGSGDARKQPLWFFLTTAGTDRNSICWEVHQKALDILEGRKHDPRFYPVMFGLPDDADWQDEANWYKANPSLDQTISIEKVRDAYHKATETPADENMFRQLRLNQWVKQSVRWMPMDKWDECGGGIDLASLAGRACYAGLDLSSTSDLTALVLVFPPENEDGVFIALPFFWLPEETLPLRVRRDHVMYDVWEKQKYLMTTEGNVVHYGYIEKFICALAEVYNIREIAFDRWNASMMVQTLQDDGFNLVPFGQGFKDMSPPTKELMRIVLEHKLNHGGHPVLRWNMDNAYVRTDPSGNIKLDKEKSTEKIDGAVALIMALDRAMKNMNGGSIYDTRDMLTLDW